MKILGGFLKASVLSVLCLTTLKRTYGAGLVVHLVPYSSIDVSQLIPASREGQSKKATYLHLEGQLEDEKVFDLLYNVLDQLDNSVSRKFSWTETMYFKRWYVSLNEHDKTRVQRVVRDKQLEFVGGFSTEIEEAVTAGETLISLFHKSHQFIRETFSLQIRHGWQIGSKGGHSDTVAEFLAEQGFETILIANVHHLVKSQLQKTQHMEFIWRYSSDDQTKGILTHVLEEDEGVLEGYDFEKPGVRQVTNAKRRAEKLVKSCRERAASFKTDHLLIPFGGDYKFKEAEKQFNNLEKLMAYINRKISDIEIKFSTLSEYFDSLKQTLAITSATLPSFSGDFFPVARTSVEYEIGRFSQNPFLSADVGHLGSVLNQAESLYALARSKFLFINKNGEEKSIKRITSVTNGKLDSQKDESNNPDLWTKFLFKNIQHSKTIWEAATNRGLSTTNIASTVVTQMEHRVEEGIEEAVDVLLESLELLLSKPSNEANNEIYKPELTIKAPKLDGIKEKEFFSMSHPVIVTNGLFKARKELFFLELPSEWPVSWLRQIQIINHEGQIVVSQVFKRLKVVEEEGTDYSFTSQVAFTVEIPALGFTTYYVTAVSPRNRLSRTVASDSGVTNSFSPAKVYRMEGGKPRPEKQRLRTQKELERDALRQDTGKPIETDSGIETLVTRDKVLTIENSALLIEVSTETGMIIAIEDKKTNRKTFLKQNFLEFSSGRESKSTQILFDPKRSEQTANFGNKVTISIVEGSMLSEITVLVHSAAEEKNILMQQIRLSTDDIILGGVDISLSVTYREEDSDLLLRFATNMGSTGEFLTDDSFNNIVRRQSYDNTPVASNFYPTHNSLAIQDSQVSSEGQMLHLTFPRPFPVSSLAQISGAAYSANMDIMLQRNYRDDQGMLDARRDFVFTNFRLTLGTPLEVTASRWELIQRVKQPLFPIFALESQNLQPLLKPAAWREMFLGKAQYISNEFSHQQLSAWPGGMVVQDQFSNDVMLNLVTPGTGISRTVAYKSFFDQTIHADSFKEIRSRDDEPKANEAILEQRRGAIRFNPGSIRSFVMDISIITQDDEVQPKKVDYLLEESELEDETKTDVTFNGEDADNLSDEDLRKVYLEQISSDEKLLKVLENRAKRARTNLEELKKELHIIAKTNLAAKEETVRQIEQVDIELKKATEQLVQKLSHLKEIQQKLELLNFKMRAATGKNLNIFSSDVFSRENVMTYQEMKEWEATLHGLVTGAGGMLVLVLLYNLMCTKMDRLPRVPIKWVGFDETSEHPLRKSN